MRYLDRGGIRHVVMRAGLGFALGWFGVQEVRAPSDWAVFVPSFVADHSPVPLNDLIVLHGYLLVIAAAAVFLGLLYVPGCLLAAGLLAEIVAGLWLKSGLNDLVVRDIGLLSLAAGLTMDPVRSWRVDNVLLSFPLLAQWLGRPPATTNGRPSIDVTRTARAVAGAVMAAAAAGVLVLAVVVRGAGGSGQAPPQPSVASSSSTAARPSPDQTSPSPSSATPTPAPSPGAASSVLFNDWPYKKYAFQVYPGEPSDQTKRALAGFQLSVQDQGDKVIVMLKALSSRYRDAQVAVDTGDTVYFIETSMGDDSSGLENDLGDDGIIVVNPQGYILQS